MYWSANKHGLKLYPTGEKNNPKYELMTLSVSMNNNLLTFGEMSRPGLDIIHGECVGRSDWTLSVDAMPDTEPVSLYRLGSTLSGIIRG